MPADAAAAVAARARLPSRMGGLGIVDTEYIHDAAYWVLGHAGACAPEARGPAGDGTGLWAAGCSLASRSILWLRLGRIGTTPLWICLQEKAHVGEI